MPCIRRQNPHSLCWSDLEQDSFPDLKFSDWHDPKQKSKILQPGASEFSKYLAGA